MKNKMLIRQLKKSGLSIDALPSSLDDWNDFLNRIEKAYDENTQDHYLLERSLEISSKEMQTRWENLKQLEQQWRSLGECTPDLVIMIDTTGRIVFSNRAESGLTKEALIDRELYKIYPSAEGEKIKAAIENSLLKKQISTFEMEEPNSAGCAKLFAVRINPILQDQTLTNLIYVKTDITESRQMEKEILARKKAEQAVEVKSRFLANMSHEIRTPLNGILGIANLLSDKITDNDGQNKLTLIKKSGETLLAIVNDLLDFSRLEAGKVSIQKSPFDLPQAVKDIVELLAPKAEEKNILLQYKISPNVPLWLENDSSRFRQILLNLIGNAIKFTEHGSVNVEVCSVLNDNDKHEIIVKIRDTGAGMSEDAQQKLFLPFSQVDAGTTRKFGGTGLGLSICKGLSEAMGGKIGVSSAQGLGSEFYFTISGYAKAPVETHEKPKPLDLHLPLAPMKILVAEDNQINQTVILAMLKKIGHSVEIAENGKKAVEALEGKNFDLILMDCHMPEMDGFEASQIIKSRWRSSSPFIIAATASALEEDRKRCLDSGMEAVVAKPIVLKILKEILDSFHEKLVAKNRKTFSLEQFPIFEEEKLLACANSDEQNLQFFSESKLNIESLIDDLAKGNVSAGTKYIDQIYKILAPLGCVQLLEMLAKLRVLLLSNEKSQVQVALERVTLSLVNTETALKQRQSKTSKAA